MRIALIGAGGHAKVVCSIARRLGYEVLGYYDDGRAPGTMMLGAPVLGTVEQARQAPDDCWLHVSLGQNQRRAEVFLRLLSWGRAVATLIDPSAVLDETVVVGEGTVIMPGVVVNVDSRIGRNCILNTCCSLDHDGVLGDHVHLCPGTHLAGSVTVGEGAMLGTGVSVIPGCSIGARTTVGAGSVVLRNLPPDQTVMGVPARPRGHATGL
jgi:sugar O-acyltransferase (sialic acid O-acetyltransferase NeuD family)